MKQIYTTLIAFLISVVTFATTVTADSNGGWTTAGTWDLNRVPQNGDTIVIPENITVSVNGVIQLDNVVIIIYGTLDLNNGKLRLDEAGRVIIHTTGTLTGLNSNDQLTIGGVQKYKGSDGPITGYAYADSSTGAHPNGFVTASPAPLPVVFQSFYITRQGSNIQLNWATSEEVNNRYYEIERSSDTHTWKKVAVVLGSGSTSSVSKYAYTDKNVNETIVYYRIRQIDINGNAQYSAIRILRSNTTDPVTNIYSSSKQTIAVDFNSDVKDNVTIQVMNLQGQVIARRNYKQASYRLTLNMMSAGSGIYVVQVCDRNGWSEVKKIAL